jgi:hypothetical protein
MDQLYSSGYSHGECESRGKIPKKRQPEMTVKISEPTRPVRERHGAWLLGTLPNELLEAERMAEATLFCSNPYSTLTLRNPRPEGSRGPTGGCLHFNLDLEMPDRRSGGMRGSAARNLHSAGGP